MATRNLSRDEIIKRQVARDVFQRCLQLLSIILKLTSFIYGIGETIRLVRLSPTVITLGFLSYNNRSRVTMRYLYGTVCFDDLLTTKNNFKRYSVTLKLQMTVPL